MGCLHYMNLFYLGFFFFIKITYHYDFDLYHVSRWQWAVSRLTYSCRLVGIPPLQRSSSREYYHHIHDTEEFVRSSLDFLFPLNHLPFLNPLCYCLLFLLEFKPKYAATTWIKHTVEKIARKKSVSYKILLINERDTPNKNRMSARMMFIQCLFYLLEACFWSVI